MTELVKFERLFRKSLETIFLNFDIEKADEILDNRDLTEFADLWTVADQEIENDLISLADKTQIDEARKKIFMWTLKQTSSSDLSAYISDDFDLIASHLLGRDKNYWVTSLCATYFDNKIPEGQLEMTSKTLKELIDLKQ